MVEPYDIQKEFREAALIALRGAVDSGEEFANAVELFGGIPWIHRGLSTHQQQGMRVEVLWEFVRRGLIIPGRSHVQYTHSAPNALASFPHFTFTEFARKALRPGNGLVSAEEPEQYTVQARAAFATANPLVFTYLEEAAQTYVARRPLAATVMLGVAAELLLEEFTEALKNHLLGDEANAFRSRDDQERRKAEKRYNTFRNTLAKHQSDFASETWKYLDNNLDTLFNLMRTNRDDVAHGRPSRADQDLVAGGLMLFPALLRLASDTVSVLTAPCISTRSEDLS